MRTVAAARYSGRMKDWSLSVFAVLALALAIGVAFRWLYPQVALSGELAGLFVFVALALKLIASKLWSLLHKPRAPSADVKAGE
jgi:hypothetical protein